MPNPIFEHWKPQVRKQPRVCEEIRAPASGRPVAWANGESFESWLAWEMATCCEGPSPFWEGLLPGTCCHPPGTTVKSRRRRNWEAKLRPWRSEATPCSKLSRFFDMLGSDLEVPKCHNMSQEVENVTAPNASKCIQMPPLHFAITCYYYSDYSIRKCPTKKMCRGWVMVVAVCTIAFLCI